MHTAKPAIKIAQMTEGWSWLLIDGSGAVAAAGAAPEQQDAMEAAWRTARSFAGDNWTAFPEIEVDRQSAPSPSALDGLSPEGKTYRAADLT